MEAPSSPLPQPVHPAVAPLSFLLGKWRGEGEGGFPTINSFLYGEELTFSHYGKPVIAYTQKTWKLDSGEPMHAESGYWRPKPDGSIEVVISQSTGLVEVLATGNKCNSDTVLNKEVFVVPLSLILNPICNTWAEVFTLLNAAHSTGKVFSFGAPGSSEADASFAFPITQKGAYDADNRIIYLHSELVGNASKVREIDRKFEVVNGCLSYVVQMATNLASLQPHLKAVLSKL